MSDMKKSFLSCKFQRSKNTLKYGVSGIFLLSAMTVTCSVEDYDQTEEDKIESIVKWLERQGCNSSINEFLDGKIPFCPDND